MTERRYDEAEVAAIFERATEAPSAGSRVDAASGGMTLSQLQEIGAEVGISADAIAMAAATVDQPAPPPQRRFLGLPLSASRTMQLDRTLTESEWELLVAQLRETFNAPGQVTSHGSLRQWTNGNLQVLLEPTATGQRIRLRTEKKEAAAGIIVGLTAFFGSAAALGTAAALNALGDRGMVVALTSALVVGTGLVASTVLPLGRWARTRQQQFDTIAARVARMVQLPPVRSHGDVHQLSAAPVRETLQRESLSVSHQPLHKTSEDHL